MKTLYFFLALLSGCAVLAQSKEEIKRSKANRDNYLFAVTTEPQKFDETVSCEIVTDEILVPVTINGKTYTFLFDTGAVTIVSAEVIKELGLTAATSNKFVDSAGNTSLENFYVVPEIAFGAVRFRNVGAGSFDLAKFSQLLCRPIHGILGSNMMRVCNWEIDYDASTVRMASDRITIPDSHRVPFEQNFSGTPRVRLEMAGINFLADVDTGNNGSLDIPQQYFEQSRLRNAAKIATSQGRGFYSLLGNAEQEEFVVMADSLYIGSALLSRRIRISPSPMTLIGNDFFSPLGRFAINYKKRELLLPKKKHLPKPETTFGFTPLLDKGKMVVGVLWKNSQAEKENIALNDELISLNGTDVSGIGEMEWCALRSKLMVKERLDVVVRKPGGETISVSLQKYDVLE